MATNTTTIDEQIENLAKAIEGLTKYVQERDVLIAKLMNKESNSDISHTVAKQGEDHGEAEAPTKRQARKKEKPLIAELQVSLDGVIPADQLKEFIMETINGEFYGSSKSSPTYAKPYTPRIDALKMPAGYQPPEFQQFDGKGNPR